MASLKVPVIAIVIGEGGSGGALGIGIANKVLMLESTWTLLYLLKVQRHYYGKTVIWLKLQLKQ